MQVESDGLIGKLGDPQWLGQVVSNPQSIVTFEFFLDDSALLDAHGFI